MLDRLWYLIEVFRVEELKQPVSIYELLHVFCSADLQATKHVWVHNDASSNGALPS